jgi:hypothetical protein
VHYHAGEEVVKYIELNFNLEPLQFTFGTPMPNNLRVSIAECILRPGELVTKLWCIRDHEKVKGFGLYTNYYKSNSDIFPAPGSLAIGKMQGLLKKELRHQIDAPEGHAFIDLKFQLGIVAFGVGNLTHAVVQNNETGELFEKAFPRIKPPPPPPQPRPVVAAPVAPKSKGCCASKCGLCSP